MIILVLTWFIFVTLHFFSVVALLIGLKRQSKWGRNILKQLFVVIASVCFSWIVLGMFAVVSIDSSSFLSRSLETLSVKYGMQVHLISWCVVVASVIRILKQTHLGAETAGFGSCEPAMALMSNIALLFFSFMLIPT